MPITALYTDYALEQILALCSIPSPTGYTMLARNYLVETLSALGYIPRVTNKGVIFIELGGEGKGLLLSAHIDTLGAMVRSVKSGGRLRLSLIGGYPANCIEGENCTIHTRTGKKYSGTVQLTHASVHVYKDTGEMARNEETVEVVVDEDVFSAQDVRNLGISPGDFISFDPRTVVTPSGYVKSRYLDNKAGSGILLSLARWNREEKIALPRKVYLMFTNYEEVGHGGSSGIPPDVEEMVVVDMGAVGDDLETNEHKVSICAKDSGGGPYDYDVTSRLVALAKRIKVDFAVDIYPRYGSDVGAALRAGYDLKHGLVGPGVFASHGYERTHRDGIRHTLMLLAAYLKESY